MTELLRWIVYIVVAIAITYVMGAFIAHDLNWSAAVGPRYRAGALLVAGWIVSMLILFTTEDHK